MLYGFSTLYGFPEYVGTKENVSIDEFIELWENMPEGSTICGANTQRYIYNYVLREQFGSFAHGVFGRSLHLRANVGSESPSAVERANMGSEFHL